MELKLNKNSLVGISPWAILGAVLILSVVFLFMTFDNISLQKEKTIRILAEKGAALIRSVEAGSRTGMMIMPWGGDQVQSLLEETAQQPDIVHLIVTDVRGRILAHSDPARIGGTHGEGLDLSRIARSHRVEWRRLSGPGDRTTFEVYRRFAPTVGRFPGLPMPRGWVRENDWYRPHMMEQRSAAPEQILFIGFDLDPFETARKKDAVHTVIMALVLLLIGFAGIVTLFLAQAYQTTRNAFIKVKAFSDNLVENMPIGLLAMDAAGRVISFNQAAEAILGLSFKEVYGREAEKILPRAMLDLTGEIKYPEGVVESEIDCLLKNGKRIPLDASATSFQDGQGEFMGHLILFRDLTEIRALREEVERNKRLASLGSLAAGVAHEIRNPLSSIKGFATYFRERYRDIPEDQKTAEIMVHEVDRLNRVVTQLLEFASPLAVQKKPVSVPNLIQHSLDVVRAQAEAGRVTIETDLDPAVQEAPLDEDRLSQVLLNLYYNSLEAMDGGGRLTVRLARAEARGINIIVADTGSGISTENLPHIFDPYFTTRAAGTGLGLAIVSKIVEAHGGEIKVSSRLGEGTEIQIFLPVI